MSLLPISEAMSESLFSKYVSELTNTQYVLEDDNGFVRYEIKGNECYIHDIYVLPEYRKSGLCYELSNQVVKIAKDKGCNLLTGTVIPSNNNSTKSLQVLLGYGMKLHSSQNNLIVMVKEI